MPLFTTDQKQITKPRNPLNHFFHLPIELREKVTIDGGLSTKDNVSFFSSNYYSNCIKSYAEKIAACNVTYIEFNGDRTYRASALGDQWQDQEDAAKTDLLAILTHFSHPTELIDLTKAIHRTLAAFIDQTIPALIQSRDDFLKKNDPVTCLSYMSEMEFNWSSVNYYRAVIDECLDTQRRLEVIADQIASAFGIKQEVIQELRGECLVGFNR